jgi:hypothetical protein
VIRNLPHPKQTITLQPPSMRLLKRLNRKMPVIQWRNTGISGVTRKFLLWQTGVKRC